MLRRKLTIVLAAALGLLIIGAGVMLFGCQWFDSLKREQGVWVLVVMLLIIAFVGFCVNIKWLKIVGASALCILAIFIFSNPLQAFFEFLLKPETVRTAALLASILILFVQLAFPKETEKTEKTES